MKLDVLISLCFVGIAFMSCDPYPRELERMEAALKQADSIYGKGENDTALFIPNLAEASSFFADKKQYGKAALAALYNGYAEKDYDKVEAMASFKEAERYGGMVHDSLTVARAQYQMGRMLYYEGAIKESLAYFRKADAGFKKHAAERAIVRNVMAASYIMLREFDSAQTCLDRSLLYADLGQSADARRKALNNYAVFYQLNGAYEKSIKCLKLVDIENGEQQLLNYMNLAEAFDLANMTDSAECYYNKMKQNIEDADVKIETKCAAYEDLFELAERHGNWEEAIGYRKNYEELLLQSLHINNQKNVYRIHQQYDHESLQNALNRKIANRQRIIVFVCGLLAFLTAVLAILQHRIALKTKQETEAKERALYYVQQYYDMLSKQRETIQKAAIVMENKNNRWMLNDLIRTVLGTKDPWEAIEEVFQKLHPEEYQNMDRQFPDLTELERKDLILSRFNVSRQDEAMLLHISIHLVDKTRQKTKEKTLKK